MQQIPLFDLPEPAPKPQKTRPLSIEEQADQLADAAIERFIAEGIDPRAGLMAFQLRHLWDSYLSLVSHKERWTFLALLAKQIQADEM